LSPPFHLRRLRSGLLLVSALLTGSQAIAQIPDAPSTQRSAPDSARHADTLRTNAIPAYGRLATDETGSVRLESASFIWSDARYLGDLLPHLPSTYLHELGEPGLPPQLSFSGIDLRGSAAMLDGVPLNDPVTGTFDLYAIPLEYVETVERISGTRGHLLPRNSVGGALNAVSHQYNTIRPVTKIRFVQGPFEHLLTDGLFTQDVARHLNLSVGFQRQAGDGRFTNAKYDAWLVRTRLRYDVTNRFNIIGSYIFADSRNGLNGGVFVDSTRSVFEEASTTVVNESAHQRTMRSDYVLTLVARIFADSSSVTTLDVVSSQSERDLNDRITTPASPFDDYSWNSFRIQGRQQLVTRSFRAGLFAQYERTSASAGTFFTDASKAYWSVATSLEIPVPFVFLPRITAELQHDWNQTVIDHGFDLVFRPTDRASLAAGISRRSRFPTFLEHFWHTRGGPVPSSDLVERHQVLSVEGALHLADWSTIALSASYRAVENAQMISAVPNQRFAIPLLRTLPELTLLDASVAVHLHLGRWAGTASATVLNMKADGAPDKLYPGLAGSCEVFYQDAFFKDHLHARVGLRGRFAGSHTGMQFFPSLLLFGANADTRVPSFSPVDLFGAFRVGDVHFSLTAENILNEEYFLVPTYPMLGRSFRLGINWKFLD